jgi:hypothetical protein
VQPDIKDPVCISCCRFYIGQLVRACPFTGGLRAYGIGVVTEHHCWDDEWPFDVMVDGQLFYYKADELRAVP